MSDAPRGDERPRAVRVVVLDHTAALGGAELALGRLLDALEPGVAAVTTVLFSDGPLRVTLESAGHDVVVLPLDRRFVNTQRHDVGVLKGLRLAAGLIPFVWRLGRLISRMEVDVVHTTSLKADLIGSPAAWLARRPLVWHVHDRITPDYLPRAVVALLRVMARRIPRELVVNSMATARSLPGVARLSVAYPGVSAAQVMQDLTERVPPAVETVGMIGRISPTKGQLEFVRAAALVLGARPDVRFRIVGAALFAEQDYEREVRAEVVALGISDRVEFTGFRPDPLSELDSLTVCVHASGTPEPFGQVIVEAMVRGVPVVATRGGGVTEIVEPGGEGPHGVLVPPHEPAALAQAISEVLSDPETARARAEGAWAAARARFGIDETAEVITRAWRHAASGR